MRQAVLYKGDGIVMLVTGELAEIAGEKVQELETDRVYELRMMPAWRANLQRPLYELLTYRKQITLIGSPRQGTDGVEFETVLGNTWHLTGSLAESLLVTTRFEPPEYQPSEMTLGLTVFAAPEADRARATDALFVPTYACELESLPAVKLWLSKITADHSLDVNQTIDLFGGGSLGTGTCVLTGVAYGCALRHGVVAPVSWSFSVPATESTFGFSLASDHPEVNERRFRCVVTQPADLAAQSEG